MVTKNPSAEHITTQLQGRDLSHVRRDKHNQLTLHFSDGRVLTVEAATEELALSITHIATKPATDSHPTKKQFEYLTFIAKYISRYGMSPAESDIGRHFLISAPTVNQMMKTLERKGFITRKPNTPRSIKMCINLEEL
jgi:repressor LexA